MLLPFMSIASRQGSAIPAAVSWIEAALLGSAATSIAVLTVAALGVGMLWGRLDLRAAARMALGAFILFGAPLIAYQMTNALRDTAAIAPYRADPSPAVAAPPRMPKNAPTQDPYAGASVPQLQP